MVIIARYTTQPEGQAALDMAVEEARRSEGKLVLAQARPEPRGESQSHVTAWLASLDDLRKSGQQLETRLQEQGIDARYQLLEQSSESPGAQILSLAKRLGADLIVIGVRRRSAVGKLVLGSASQEILLGAECPVLAVKAPRT